MDTESGANTNTYTASTGLSVTLKPVSPFLLQKVRQSAEQDRPKPPTYTVTTAVGATETHDHDGESIKDASDADKAAWIAYGLALQRIASEVNDRVVRLVLLRGVETDIPEYGWDRVQEETLGIKVPKDPNERKIHYLLTEVVGTAEDLTEIITGVVGLSGVGPEAINAAKASFRNSIRRHAPNGAGDPVTVVSLAA